MATWLANFDLGTGNNDGTSVANAFRSMQAAVDEVTLAAGDIVYCVGTDTLGANLDLDGNSGDETNGMVRFIGVSSIDPVTNDGTRAVIDGNSQTWTCIATATDFWNIENFEFTQMSGAGLGALTSPDIWFFNNCSFNNNSTFGIDSTQIQFSFFFRCTFFLNGSDGVNRGDENSFLFCSFHDNTASGIRCLNGLFFFIGSLFYDNGDDGIESFGAHSVVLNCVVEANVDNGIDRAISSSAHLAAVIGTRITNHSTAGSIGLNTNGEIMLHGWNYYEDNDGNNIQDALGNAISIQVQDNGSNTDAEDQADTNEGYTNKTDGSEDFSLRDDATSRRTAIIVPII